MRIEYDIARMIKEAANVVSASASLESEIYAGFSLMAESSRAGGTIFWAGNGGSAGEAQHMSAELMGRFKIERKPIKSIALTTDTSLLTAISNDYDFSEVFARQLKALASKSDCLVLMTTSGTSENVIKAIAAAREINTPVLLLTSRKYEGSKVDVEIKVDSIITEHIQLAHLAIGHILCEMLEKELSIEY